MARKKLLKLKKNNASNFFALLLLFLLLALIVPAIGIGPSSSSLWVSVVEFFESIRLHFQQFWMFYTFGLALIFAYLGKKK